MKETRKLTENRTDLKDQNLRKVLLCCLFITTIFFFILDLFFHRHLSFQQESLGAQFEGFIGIYSLFGLTGVLILIFGSKLLKKFIARNFDYFGEKDD